AGRAVHQLRVLRGDEDGRDVPGDVGGARDLRVELHDLAAGGEAHLHGADAVQVLDLHGDVRLLLPEGDHVAEAPRRQRAVAAEVRGGQEVALARRVLPDHRHHAVGERDPSGDEVPERELRQRPQPHHGSLPPLVPGPARPDAIPGGRLVASGVAIDTARLRADFPVLEREVNGRPLVYLDSAASSQKPRQVVEAMSDYYYRHHANVHRGAHSLSVEATTMYEDARAEVAAFVGAPDARGLVFVRNATEAVNLVAASWGRANLGPGDEVVVTVAEHHANLVPWQLVTAERGAVLRPVGLDDDGRVDMDELRAAVGPRTKLV